MPDGLRQDRAVLDYALGRLAAVFGGQPFAPGRAQMERVLAFVTGSEPGRMTAGRVVFDLRRDGLYLARESRGYCLWYCSRERLGFGTEGSRP